MDIEFTQEKYNELCARYLGADIFEEDGFWIVTGWRHTFDKTSFDTLVKTNMTPITMGDSKEETYDIILANQVAYYGGWGKFYSDWNHIMAVIEKIHTDPNCTALDWAYLIEDFPSKEKTTFKIFNFLIQNEIHKKQ
jgi:hypothetical protein